MVFSTYTANHVSLHEIDALSHQQKYNEAEFEKSIMIFFYKKYILSAMNSSLFYLIFFLALYHVLAYKP